MVSLCPECNAAFLRAEGTCLACGRADLEPSSVEAGDHAPELILSFSARPDFAAWMDDVPFPTADLARVQDRAERVWLPVWLVDAHAAGTWRADVGFDYQVQSSRETLSGGEWSSTKLVETRIRWEARAGNLVREHDNASAPALVQHDVLWDRLGGFDLDAARPASGEGTTRLPDLDPDAAWPQAERALRERLADDCRQAAGAEHIREFRLDASYTDQHWTWLLVPVFATWYADDDGRRHLVLANGRTGRIAGPRYASPSKGLKWAVGIGLMAGVMLLITLVIGLVGLVMPVLFVVAAVTGVLFLVLAMAALWPLIRPRHHNRRQGAKEIPLV